MTSSPSPRHPSRLSSQRRPHGTAVAALVALVLALPFGWALLAPGASGAGEPSTILTGVLEGPANSFFAVAVIEVLPDGSEGEYDYVDVAADGRWSASVPVARKNVRVRFQGRPAASGYYQPEAPGRLVAAGAHGALLDVRGGGTQDLGTITLPDGGRLVGRSSADTRVDLLALPSGDYVTDNYVSVGTSDLLDGSVLAGAYTLEIGRDSGSTPFRAQYLDGVPVEEGLEKAGTLEIVDGGTTRRDVVGLLRGGTVKGRLIDSGGKPLVSCLVRAVDPTRALPTRVASRRTDVQGRFTIPGLSPRSYRIAVNGGRSCAGPETWLAGRSLQRRAAGSTLVAAEVGVTRDVGTIRHYGTFRPSGFSMRPSLYSQRIPIRVGDTIYARGGRVKASGGLFYVIDGTYVMFRDGMQVGKARSLDRPYTVVAADRGHRLSIRVTGRGAGTREITGTSAATAKVR